MEHHKLKGDFSENHLPITIICLDMGIKHQSLADNYCCIVSLRGRQHVTDPSGMSKVKMQKEPDWNQSLDVRNRLSY